MADQLKACPFPSCGAPAMDAHAVSGFGLCTRCSNVDCSLHDVWTKIKVWNRRAHSPAVRELVKVARGLIPTLRSGDWGNQDETANEIDAALAAVEREIGQA